MILGNNSQQESFRQILTNHVAKNQIALSGPAHLGKASFARELLTSSLNESDFIEMESGIDGVRSVVEFCRTEPLNNNIKAVLIDDADRLLEPAQDGLLKLLEETPTSTVLILILHDIGSLQPAFLSRIRTNIKWHKLSDTEMNEFADSLLITKSEQMLRLSNNSTGLYKVMSETDGFSELYDSAVKLSKSELNILSPIPSLISKLDTGPGLVRDAVIQVLRMAVKDTLHNTKSAVEILRFCSVLSTSMSSNSEIHWMRLVMNLSM